MSAPAPSSRRTPGVKSLPKEERQKRKQKLVRQQTDADKSRSRLKAQVGKFAQAAIDSHRFSNTMLTKISDMAKNMLTEISYNLIKVVHNQASDLIRKSGRKNVKAKDIQTATKLLLMNEEGPKIVERVSKRADALFKKITTDHKEAKGGSVRVYDSELYRQEGLEIIPSAVERIANHQNSGAGKLIGPGAVALSILVQEVIEEVLAAAVKTAKKAGESSWVLKPVHIQRGIQRTPWLAKFVGSNQLIGQFQFKIPMEIEVKEEALATAAPSRKRKRSSASKKFGCGTESCAAKKQFGWGKKKQSPYKGKKKALKSLAAILSDVDSSDSDDDDSSDSDSDIDLSFLKPSKKKRAVSAKKLFEDISDDDDPDLDFLEAVAAASPKKRRVKTYTPKASAAVQKKFHEALKLRLAATNDALKIAKKKILELKKSGGSETALQSCLVEKDKLTTEVANLSAALEGMRPKLPPSASPATAALSFPAWGPPPMTAPPPLPR
jgi:histone H3/H4